MATRKYSSELREQQAEQTRQRILEGAARIALFDFRRVTHASAARASGVSERTVYRHFPTVADLHAAFEHFQVNRLGVGYPETLTVDDLPRLFERWPSLIHESYIDDYLRDLDPPPMLMESRRKRYGQIQQALAALLPEATTAQLQSVVVVFGALMSPESFVRGKSFFNLKLTEIAPGPAWAMRVLIEALRRGDTPWKRS